MPRPAQSTNISLDHLRSAVAAADYGSFRKAAERLAVKHSALSREIAQFERLLGLTIFERSPSGVVPTSEGLGLLRLSRTILDQIDTLVLSAGFGRRCGSNYLSVGFCTSISAGNLRESLADFIRRDPNVDLAAHEHSRNQLLDLVHSEALDVAIIPGEHTFSGQKSLPIWSERILVLLPNVHPLARHSVIHWTDLRGEPVLLSRHSGSDLADLASRFLAGKGHRMIKCHDVSGEAIKSLVGIGLGISLVTEADIGSDSFNLVYREVHDGYGPTHIDFHAYWREDNENPALFRFLQLVTERYPSPASADDR